MPRRDPDLIKRARPPAVLPDAGDEKVAADERKRAQADAAVGRADANQAGGGGGRIGGWIGSGEEGRRNAVFILIFIIIAITAGVFLFSDDHDLRILVGDLYKVMFGALVGYLAGGSGRRGRG